MVRWTRPNSGSSAGRHVPPLDVVLRTLFTDPAMARGRALARVQAWVTSDEYACPGNHFSRALTFDEAEEEAETGRLPTGVTWVSKCPETLVIDLEWEGDEYGGQRHTYPVADGPCVEALGFDDERLYDHAIMGQFSERRRVRKLLNGGWLSTRLEDLPALRNTKTARPPLALNEF